MLELKNICKEFVVNKCVKVHALNNVSIRFGDKGFVAVVGKSGSGKTTLLNLLGGIDNPTSGEVFLNGRSFEDFKEKDYDDYRNFHVGFVFQHYNLLEDYSVVGNIKLALNFQQNSKGVIEQKAHSALEKVGIADLANRKIKTLSGGQKQRVAVARALAKDSSIILCDEPTGNLDSSTSNQVIEVLKEISKERLVVVITHDDEICGFADRIIRLKDGAVVEDMHKKLPQSQFASTRPKNNKIKSYQGVSVKNSFQMIGNNISHSAVSTALVALLMVAVFALMTVFFFIAAV